MWSARQILDFKTVCGLRKGLKISLILSFLIYNMREITPILGCED